MKTYWDSPSRDVVLENEAVRLSSVQLDRDLDTLYRAVSVEANQGDLFEYLLNAPAMTDVAVLKAYLEPKLARTNEVMYQVYSHRLGEVVGAVSLMNIQPSHGTVEVGSLWYSKKAQRTEVNTNVMSLLFGYVFDTLGYRRLEWKCNARNDASRQAALRLGFEFEGLFRQHYISRGQNRDTAWYSIIDAEWPEKKARLATMLRRA